MLPSSSVRVVSGGPSFETITARLEPGKIIVVSCSLLPLAAMPTEQPDKSTPQHRTRASVPRGLPIVFSPYLAVDVICAVIPGGRPTTPLNYVLPCLWIPSGR